MTAAKFQEDGYDQGSETLTIALDTSNTRVSLGTESDDVWPPLYFTPARAREIGQALLDAARAADGSTDPASLFAEPQPVSLLAEAAQEFLDDLEPVEEFPGFAPTAKVNWTAHKKLVSALKAQP